MKSRLRINFSIVTGLVVLSLILASCYERVEGCLDSNADNYDVYADDDCCCTYPTLQVNLIKQVDDVTYVSTDTYTNALGQEYQISAQSFYISDLTLGYADGSTSEVTDTLIRDIPADSDNEVIIEDNFGLVRQTSVAYQAGSIETSGDITAVSFRVGLTDEINMLVPSQMTTTHPLGTANESDHFVEGNGYIYVRWEILVIEPAGIGTIEISSSTNLFPVIVELPASIEVRPGTDTQLPLVVDYGDWLEGIDFAADIDVIASQISANTSAAFSLQ